MGFMDALVARMVQTEPDKRPSMDEVVTSLNEIIAQLSKCQLRQRLVEREDGIVINFFKGVHHLSFRAIPHMLARRSPMPTSKLN